jgi:hypothetical protein
MALLYMASRGVRMPRPAARSGRRVRTRSSLGRWCERAFGYMCQGKSLVQAWAQANADEDVEIRTLGAPGARGASPGRPEPEESLAPSPHGKSSVLAPSGLS